MFVISHCYSTSLYKDFQDDTISTWNLKSICWLSWVGFSRLTNQKLVRVPSPLLVKIMRWSSGSFEFTSMKWIKFLFAYSGLVLGRNSKNKAQEEKECRVETSHDVVKFTEKL